MEQESKRATRTKFLIDAETLHRDYQTMTMLQIAQKYGVGETTVHARIKKLGITNAYGPMGHRHRKREFSDEHRRKMSEARKGKFGAEANGNWKGGVSYKHASLRRTIDYRLWRVAALELRGGACQECGALDGSKCECCGTRVKLHVHHVKSFARVPEERFNPLNSEVLCPKCHWKRHYRTIG